MELSIKHTPVFTKNFEAFNNTNLRFIVNQGGTRSSKTYSIVQLLIWYAITNQRKEISIVRKTYPALANSVMADLIFILNELNIPHIHNKSKSFFLFATGSKISFFSVDNPQKIRGRKHDIVFINEANELTFEDFQQLNLRTTSKLLIDFNPSDQFSWIWDLLKDPKSIKIHSTYKDNPFLEPHLIREIENLINVDDNYYRIYTLGEPASTREKVFQRIQLSPFPTDIDFIYGMDFGFNDPTALVKIAIRDGNIWIKQEIYESYLTTEDLIRKMKALNISQQNCIFADAARPDQINSISNAGFWITKGKKNIQEGLDFIKTLQINIDPSSEDVWKEFNNYSYKKIKGITTDIPVDFMNHSIDATRYAAISKKEEGFGVSFMV